MKPIIPSSPSNKKSFFSIYVVTISFIVFVTILYAKDFTCAFQQAIFQASPQQLELDQQSPTSTAVEKDVVLPFAIGKAEECDVFAGTWVYDQVSRPQYEESECPYIPPQLACQAHGRPDKDYQHWRWQPHGCSLPSFNATLMLEKLRGKRMMFVGDSLSRGHFMSMVCLLHQAIPKTAKPLETNGSLTLFRAEEYNTSVGFYWAPFLVESNADDPVIHKVTSRIVRAGAINKHAKHWKGVDIVVFNTYLWWMTRLKLKILRGPFEGDMKDMRHMEREDAYRLVLRRMVRWVEKNIDPHKTRIFFNTMSPLHEWGQGWGGDGNCYNETTPIMDPAYWGAGSIKGMMRVVGEVLGKAKVPITLLNTTQLSEYRKDAHTSVYREFFNNISPEQRANPRSYADCVHWCLPGLPDTWNEILYTKLFFPKVLE